MGNGNFDIVVTVFSFFWVISIPFTCFLSYVKSLTKEYHAVVRITLKSCENICHAEIIASARENRKQKREKLRGGSRKKSGIGVKGVGRRKNAVV